MRRSPISILILLLTLGCDESIAEGPDAGEDAGSDAGEDAGSDAGEDAGSDSGSACECAAVSTCCDGCHPRNEGASCDDGLACSATSACSAEGTCDLVTPTCAVTSTQCQSRTCDEVLGCGPIVSIREEFACDDGDVDTFDDVCTSGACAGTPYACTIQNGGCVGDEVCVPHDPSPNTCECTSGRYRVTATTVLDSTTGLEWQRGESPAELTYAGSLTYCAGLSLDGGGWRLPDIDELRGIHTGPTGGPLYADLCAFPTTATAQVFYRSSTEFIMDHHMGLMFSDMYGHYGVHDGDPEPVRCVR